MGGWGEFAGVFALFLASHAIPARPAVKARIVAVLGRCGYLAAFIVLSVVLLGWLVVAAGRAPYLGLWPQQNWQRWVANLTMPLVFVLPGAALLRGRWRPARGPQPWRVGLAVAAWLGTLWAHPIVIGVSPLPW